jgi:hypothetical protein
MIYLHFWSCYQNYLIISRTRGTIQTILTQKTPIPADWKIPSRHRLRFSNARAIDSLLLLPIRISSISIFWWITYISTWINCGPSASRLPYFPDCSIFYSLAPLLIPRVFQSTKFFSHSLFCLVFMPFLISSDWVLKTTWSSQSTRHAILRSLSSPNRQKSMRFKRDEQYFQFQNLSGFR